uniref:Uncharacterized protein n=1 Tax=Megaviridae environmental sample TaxID=1737588 RepID=A0A5J6VJH8_9VIRU|nr:MAG: hypothetical protein [Megaviridae environmental sample]
MANKHDRAEYINNIIKSQSICRRWLSSKKNIYMINKKFRALQLKFTKVINGYHIINTAPINGCIWEPMNCEIVRDVCSIADEANGNHVSGKDNRFDNIDYSNKTCKLENNICRLSSYRLTKVCNKKNIGESQEILNEIEKRDGSFDHYSILLRDEKENQVIEYIWYIIPKDYHIFKIDKLVPKLGKDNKNRGQIIGWESKVCSITFSMSSQLWFQFDIKDIEKYKVCFTTVDNSKSKVNFSQIYDIFDVFNNVFNNI